MRISELSARTDVPVGTIKYYLREGLLAAGRTTSRTTAEYDETHVERIRLVRALTDAGGLGIAAVRRIVEVIDSPEPERLDVLGTAQQALLDEDESVAPGHAVRARAWVQERGWTAFPGDPVLARLERAWEACEQAGVPVGPEMLDRYAEAMELVAGVDVDSVPQEATGAVRRVIVGTVMLEPVLLALRMMAQRELSLQRARRAQAGGDGSSACEAGTAGAPSAGEHP